MLPHLKKALCLASLSVLLSGCQDPEVIVQYKTVEVWPADERLTCGPMPERPLRANSATEEHYSEAVAKYMIRLKAWGFGCSKQLRSIYDDKHAKKETAAPVEEAAEPEPWWKIF
jgi:hypothetical protein